MNMLDTEDFMDGFDAPYESRTECVSRLLRLAGTANASM